MVGAKFVEKAHFLAGFVMLWLQAAVNIVDVFFHIGIDFDKIIIKDLTSMIFI